MTSSRAFLDTNLLVYAADVHEKVRRRESRELLNSFAARAITPVLSTQVLQEFYSAATRKLGIDPILARGMVHAFRQYEIVTITPDLIETAIDIGILHRLSFWDGLIVAAAETARCDLLLTEDLNHGQVLRGVRVQSPFRAFRKPSGGA